jgi:hypothetical protein
MKPYVGLKANQKLLAVKLKITREYSISSEDPRLTEPTRGVNHPMGRDE